MSKVPASPKIYHLTHIDNLPKIVAAGLWSDRQTLQQGLQCEVVGMPTIKQRRLNEIEVICVPGTKVGDYVPFYLCPRSAMLYIFHKRNHPDVAAHFRLGFRRIDGFVSRSSCVTHQHHELIYGI